MMDARTPPEHVVLADVGGTHARFAALTAGVLGPIERMMVRDYQQFGDALAAFLAGSPKHAAMSGAILAVAGVVENGRCVLTNNSWVVDAAEIRARFGLADVQLINDFEAVAWSLAELEASDLRAIGGGAPVSDAPMVVLGPGTGFGVAAYVPHHDHGVVLRSEGGHATLPSASAREDRIIDVLRQRIGHVSIERVLSGHGLENLYHAISSVESIAAPERTAADITHAALQGDCAVSRAAVDLFCAFLGEVAGNLALSIGAQGGVFVTGGIVSHIREYLARSQFRPRFEAKGRQSRYVKAIPTYLILHEDPAFIGLKSFAALRRPGQRG